MKPTLLPAMLLALFVSSGSLAQGHPDASGEASIVIQRSSEHKAEGKEFHKRVPVTLEYHGGGCAATLGLEYYQKGAEAHVKSTLRNDVCGASSGTYTLRIRYRNDDDVTDKVEFEEAWSRDDDADVISEKDYFVGDDLDIRRVSTRNLTCTCKALESQEEESDSELLIQD